MEGSPAAADVTRLLVRWREGNEEALQSLTPIVYEELRRLAESYMRRESAGHTLQATALVHEAYMRLIGSAEIQFQDRAHFFGIAARLMRQVLVQHARTKGALKRGSGRKESLDEAVVISAEGSDTVIALDDALRKLAELDERKSQIIEMRYFGGLTAEEIAAVLDISTATIGRELKLAHAWLYRQIGQ
ncbi:MAG TPA: sigma-70 family RNA polymerase sigma factor [Bryobacteraceae bacterium]|nr:sigma-70 family RNA polymerase sigma factor [Bryobacteraceae bacterium]